MRREVIYQAIENILTALSESHIGHALTSCRRKGKEGTSLAATLQSFNKYSLMASSFGEAERRICQIMDIHDLDNPESWDVYINISSTADERMIMEKVWSINFAITHLPKVIELIKQDYVLELKDHKNSVPDSLKGKELLSIVVIEEKGSFSSPKRLGNILDSISVFYDVLSEVYGCHDQDLIVLAVDSGSDKSFDFLGVEKIITGIKNLIISIWDKKVYHRHNQSSADIDLIAKSLPIIEDIKRLKEDGALDHEMAGKLINKTIKAATKFIDSGATIPELNEQSSHDPRMLMKPNQKLLVAPIELEENNLKDKKSDTKKSESISSTENSDAVEIKKSISEKIANLSEEDLKKISSLLE